MHDTGSLDGKRSAILYRASLDWYTMRTKSNRDSGVTLIELLVVISVIGILAVALGISYTGWRGNYRVESEMKNIYSDLMEARTKAITRGMRYYAVLNANTYQIFEDTNNSGGNVPDADDTPLWKDPVTSASKPKTLEYRFQLAMISSDTLPITVNFDTRGFLSLSTRGLAAPASFRIDISGTDLTPDYDCIILSQASIKTGKYDGTTCKVGN